MTPTEQPTPAPEIAAPPRYLRLGEILIERKKIEAEDLERALELQRERGDKLGKILVDMGLIAQRDVLAALADQLGLPLVAVDGPPPAAPEIDGLSAPLPAPVPRVSVGPGRFHPDGGHGRPAGFRNHRAHCGPSPASRSRPRWPPSRKSSTPSTGITARATSKCWVARTSRPPPTWNTCATWPARRPSSAWSTP